MCQIDLNEGAVLNVIQQQSAALKNPAKTVDDVLDALRSCGLFQSTIRLRELADG